MNVESLIDLWERVLEALGLRTPPLRRLEWLGYVRGGSDVSSEDLIPHWAGAHGGVVVWHAFGGRWRYVCTFRRPSPDGDGEAPTEEQAARRYLRTGYRELGGR